PSFRLFDEHPNDERDSSWEKAGQEYITPRNFRPAGHCDPLDPERHVGCKKEPHRSGRVQQRARFYSPALWNDFSDHRRARRPLAADAETRNDSEQNQKRDVGGNRAQRCPKRIHGHRQQEGSGASYAIAYTSEDDASDGPTYQQ